MTVVTISRRERKKADTRQRIVAEAARIFAERGIEAATVDEIAAAADVGKGTIYNYFAAKEDIVVAFMAGLEKKVQREAERFAKRDGALGAVLTAFVRYQLRLKEPHWRFVRVFFARLFAPASEGAPWIAELQGVIDPPLETLFTALQERGRLRADVPVAEFVRLFKLAHLGIAALWAIEGPPFTESRRLAGVQMRLLAEGWEARKR